MNVNNSIVTFFLLVFALSVPFWLAGAFTGFQLLPGLPVSSLMFVCPGTAALILVYRQNGSACMISFLKRCIDYKRITNKAWYLPALLLMPFIMTVSYVWMRFMFASLQAATFQVGKTVVIFFCFFAAAIGEELGWSGYITAKMQKKWGALKASILLGMVWAIWHIIPLLQAHRSLRWIAWWAVFTVAARILIVWMYNNTGKSVFAAALFHTMINITWFLFPITGFDFNPAVSGLIVAFIALIISCLWRPENLTFFRWRLKVSLNGDHKT